VVKKTVKIILILGVSGGDFRRFRPYLDLAVYQEFMGGNGKNYRFYRPALDAASTSAKGHFIVFYRTAGAGR
jgi:hypothetical protein